MNTTRNHPRPLRYRQAPATVPFDQHWAMPIDHTRPARLETFGRVLFSLAVGAIVVLALIACGGDDLATKEADAQALQDAQAHAVQLEKEARAMAALMGMKQ